jgi:hypothetical protein
MRLEAWSEIRAAAADRTRRIFEIGLARLGCDNQLSPSRISSRLVAPIGTTALGSLHPPIPVKKVAPFSPPLTGLWLT